MNLLDEKFTNALTLPTGERTIGILGWLSVEDSTLESWVRHMLARLDRKFDEYLNDLGIDIDGDKQVAVWYEQCWSREKNSEADRVYFKMRHPFVPTRDAEHFGINDVGGILKYTKRQLDATEV